MPQYVIGDFSQAGTTVTEGSVTLYFVEATPVQAGTETTVPTYNLTGSEAQALWTRYNVTSVGGGPWEVVSGDVTLVGDQPGQTSPIPTSSTPVFATSPSGQIQANVRALVSGMPQIGEANVWLPTGSPVYTTPTLLITGVVTQSFPSGASFPTYSGYGIFILVTDSTVGTGGGGGNPTLPGGPMGENSELLDTRRGFYHAFAGGDTGISIYRSDQSFLPFTFATVVAQTSGNALSAVEPRLERMEPGDLVDLICRGGFAQNQDAQGNPVPYFGIYRFVSADRAASWSPIPAAVDGVLQPFYGSNAANSQGSHPPMSKYARQVWNVHTQEYLLLYNDTSDLDSMGNPTGQGYIQCNVYSPPPDGILVIAPDGSGSPFPVDSSTMSADSSFDAFYCTDPTAHVRCAFTDTGGAIHHYISFDDGRTWSQVAPYVVS